MTPLIEALNSKSTQKTFLGALKGLISSIPFVGSSLVGGWDGYCGSRLDDTIARLSLKIERLGEEKIDIEYVKSEEFLDLFQKSLRVRLLSRSKQKAEFVLGMLAESMQKDRNTRFSSELKESFLSVLEQLSDYEMIFLHDFSQGKFREKSKDSIYQMSDCAGIALDALLAKGILREENTWVKYVIESMFGQEFLAYLRLLAEKESELE